MAKPDRRVIRTRGLLQDALIELIEQRGYDATSVQHIVDRAGVGRTTFYLHFRSKDDLFVSCHDTIIDRFHLHQSLTREELLSPHAPPGSASAYRHLEHARSLLQPVFQSKDGPTILRRLRDRSTHEIETNLRAVFADAASAIPIELLASYLAGAQFALVQWWLEKRRPHTPEAIAQSFHRLQRAAIRDAFGLAYGQSDG